MSLGCFGFCGFFWAESRYGSHK